MDCVYVVRNNVLSSMDQHVTITAYLKQLIIISKSFKHSLLWFGILIEYVLVTEIREDGFGNCVSLIFKFVP